MTRIHKQHCGAREQLNVDAAELVSTPKPGMRREEYVYKSIPVPGGGFVTGFVFHPEVPNILYCRTDIGGNYRYDFAENRWVSLIDHATDPDAWETYPLAIALDRQHPSYVYAMVGRNPTHKIAFSDNYGAHWSYLDAPVVDDEGNTASIHGNAPGRSTGERLVVDPYDSNTLYMGTMHHGLWKTTDRCESWTRLAVRPSARQASFGYVPETGNKLDPRGELGFRGAATAGEESELNIAFIEIDPSSGEMGTPAQRIVVATSGEQGSPGNHVRGPSVYISNDAGATFQPLSGEPAPVLGGPADYPGYVGQRATFSGKYLFVSYAAYNVGRSRWDSYGCDLGSCYDGALYRYELNADGSVVEAIDVTPPSLISPNFTDPSAPNRRLGYGMSGVSSDSRRPGTLVCSTIGSQQDTVYHTRDYGLTWTPILSGLDVGRIDFNVPYQKPEYNGNHSLIHWMSDLKINPFDGDMALFNTGAGVFMTRDLSNADKGETVNFACCDEGMEETVHLNVYSPPAGDVKVIDIIGDYGGFVFTDLDRPAENTFANENHDRWITAMNADYPDDNPNLIVVTPRGNWTGQTKGGLILSRDQGRTWEQLPDPLGLSSDIDEVVQRLKLPNVTSGWVAISADGATIAWTLGNPIYASRLVYTKNFGKTWDKVKVLDFGGRQISGEDVPFKVMADRVLPDVFYGFSDNAQGRGFFMSIDGGATYHQLEAPAGFPEVNLAGIDGAQHYEIRVESGSPGTIWLAMQQYGLWRFEYDVVTHRLAGRRVSRENDFIKRIGLGKPMAGSDVKTLFTSGTIDGEYGFFKSVDAASTWVRINDDQHQFGDIRSICGDPRVFGRIYVATGTRGLVYGDMA